MIDIVKGTKVVCIKEYKSSDGCEKLQEGMIYEIVDVTYSTILSDLMLNAYIKANVGVVRFCFDKKSNIYFYDFFTSVANYRKKRITKLLQ